MLDSEKREELKRILRKAISALGDISDKIDEVTSVLSTALTLAEYTERVIIPEEIVEAQRERYDPVPITFEKKEERVAEVSTVVARPVNSRFKTLEELVSEGTRVKSMSSELDDIRDWVMALSPTFSTLLYKISQWSRKLKSYPYEKLTEQDVGELMYSIHEWKVRLSKVA